MSSLIQRYKPSYKSKAKIPEKYFEGLNAKERRLMTKEILERPESLKYWSADKAYSKRLRKEKESLPKSKYTLAFHKKYGKEAAKSLSSISKATGIRLAILKEVHKRGVGAWNGSHRPGVYPNQWARSRVMSFVVGGKTQKTTDKDLWELHLKDLKKRRKNPTDNESNFSKVKKARRLAEQITQSSNLEYIDIGNESEVFKFQKRNQLYIIKIFDENLNSSAMEYLKILSNHELIPKIYEITNKYVIMEYIDGESLTDIIFDKKSKKRQQELLSKVTKEIKKWHSEGFAHGDLYEDNILITKEKAIFIDPNLYRFSELHSLKENDLENLEDLKYKIKNNKL